MTVGYAYSPFASVPLQSSCADTVIDTAVNAHVKINLLNIFILFSYNFVQLILGIVFSIIVRRNYFLTIFLLIAVPSVERALRT